MQIFTYLGFTLLSIFIQFSVIDFIQGRLKLDDNPLDSRGVSQKRQLRDVLKDVRPHALYYRTKDKGIKNISPAKFISNITLTEFLVTTDLTTTVFDVMYEENSTGTDESYTTESLFTTTEFENVTEITFIERTNNGSTKTNTAPTKKSTEKCDCNFLIMVCDINCCCDVDCLDIEIKLFPNCVENKIAKKGRNEEYCLPQLPYLGYGNGLFCIVKVNLPENKDVIMKKTEPINHYLTWKSDERSQILYEFSNSLYKYGDPIWLYKNGTIYHSDLPVALVTNYCTGRKAMQFLKDEKYKCNVKIQDLEMLQIMKSLEEVSVISATPLSMNSSVLNCSTLYCVNWTIVVCNNQLCTNYNNSLHDPECTETVCTNIALKIGYTFYYHDSKIVNASIKFHIENMTLSLPLLTQEIEVKYVVGNRSIDKALKLSGNPGYLDGLPVIFSQAESNYTDSFYNSSINMQRYWILPDNEYGSCHLLNNSENFILFGRNRRINCRYNHKIVKFNNATDECQRIQHNINLYLDLNRNVMISPLGDPKPIEDKNWIFVERHISQSMLYGAVRDKSSKLLCFNFVPRYSITFGYAQINDINRIVSASYMTTARNVTFNMDDISTVVTIDISFIDATHPSVFEHVKRNPSLNIHLPDDFFYPFRNESPNLKCSVFATFLYLIAIISSK